MAKTRPPSDSASSLTNLWSGFLGNRIIPSMTRRLGGPMGLRSGRVVTAWAYVLGTLSWLIAMFRQMPCRETLSEPAPDRFRWMCYSDISALYFSRGQSTGGVPYIDVDWEYPVLTGYFARLANWIGDLLGADFTPGIETEQVVTNGDIYFAITAVGLFICLLWLISSQIRMAPHLPGLAMAVAISPAIMTTGLINWDLLVIALTAAGLASWMEKKPIWSGFWWGLAVAAKFYPLVIIGAMAVLCFRKGARRNGDTRSWLIMAGTAVGTWIIANIPVFITQFDHWKYFYVMNSDRGVALGSFWYALSLSGIGVADPFLWSRGTMILGFVGVAALIFFARKAPSAKQIAYLAVAVFVVCNLVYSPQYVLWLLPLVVLVRPKVLDIVVFTIAELFYFVFIWLHLRGNDLSLGISDAPWVYIFSIYIRIGATLWIMVRVVHDVITAPVEEDLHLDVRLDEPVTAG